MSRNKKRRREPYIGKGERQVVALARLVLTLISTPPNFLIAVEELKRFFPKLKIRVVDDDLLPDKEAKANAKHWTIRIRRGIYQGLLCGSARGAWTLAHELAHILLRHPGQPARARQVVENTKTQAGRREREADTFARSVLLPFDRFSEIPTNEIQKVSGASARAIDRRVVEFAQAKTHRDILLRRGFDLKRYTVEFAHRKDTEKAFAATAEAIAQTLRMPFRESQTFVEPLKENIFSSAVLVAAASELLADAYETVRTHRPSSDFVRAAAVALAIVEVCPLRSVGAQQPILQANFRCAANAALRLSNLPLIEIGMPFANTQRRRDGYTCGFLKEICETGENLIKDNSTILTLEDFSNYTEYNARHDIRWDEVHEIDYLADCLLALARIDKFREAHP
jgi:Zn-dependent peptidase ImmA (M78 family)